MVAAVHIVAEVAVVRMQVVVHIAVEVVVAHTQVVAHKQERVAEAHTQVVERTVVGVVAHIVAVERIAVVRIVEVVAHKLAGRKASAVVVPLPEKSMRIQH